MGQKQSSIPPHTEQDTPAQQIDPVPPANESRSIEPLIITQKQPPLDTSDTAMGQQQSSSPSSTEPDMPVQQTDQLPPANESLSIMHLFRTLISFLLGILAIDIEQEQSSTPAPTEPDTSEQQTDPDPPAVEKSSFQHLFRTLISFLLGILAIDIEQEQSSTPAPTEPDTSEQQTDPDPPAVEKSSVQHLPSAQNQQKIPLDKDKGKGQSSIPVPTEPDTPVQQTDPDPPAIEKTSFQHLLSTQNQLLLGTLGIHIEQGQSSSPSPNEPDTPAQQTGPDPPAIEKPPIQVILEKLKTMDMCLHEDPWKNALQWSYILANRTEEIIGCPVGSIMEMVEEAKTANVEIAEALTKVNEDCGIVSVVSGSARMVAGALGLAGILLFPVSGGLSTGLSIAGMALGATTGVTSLGANVAKCAIKKTQQRNLEAKTKALQNFQRFLKLSMEAITNAADSEEYHQVYASVKRECNQNVKYMNSICNEEEKVGARTDGSNPLNQIMECKEELWTESIGTITGSSTQVETIVNMIKVINDEGVAHESLLSLMGAQEVTLPFEIAGQTALAAGSMGADLVTSAFSAVTIGMSALEIKNGYYAIKQAGDADLVKHYLDRSKKMTEETEDLVQFYYKLKECCQELQHKVKH